MEVKREDIKPLFDELTLNNPTVHRAMTLSETGDLTKEEALMLTALELASQLDAGVKEAIHRLTLRPLLTEGLYDQSK